MTADNLDRYNKDRFDLCHANWLKALEDCLERAATQEDARAIQYAIDHSNMAWAVSRPACFKVIDADATRRANRNRPNAKVIQLVRSA